MMMMKPKPSVPQVSQNCPGFLDGAGVSPKSRAAAGFKNEGEWIANGNLLARLRLGARVAFLGLEIRHFRSFRFSAANSASRSATGSAVSATADCA